MENIFKNSRDPREEVADNALPPLKICKSCGGAVKEVITFEKADDGKNVKMRCRICNSLSKPFPDMEGNKAMKAAAHINSQDHKFYTKI